jgi:SAM-dependent methyltransferase
MEPGIRRDHWDAIYTSTDPSALSWFQPDPATSIAMIHDAGVKLDARILDIGGGASTLPDHLLAEGFKAVTVMDTASAAMDRSRQRLGRSAEEITWIAADVLTWEPQIRCDLWHDRAVFHFLTNPEDRARYISRLRTALVPGGSAIFATFALNGPRRCSGLPVQRYSAETLSTELGRGFTLVGMVTEDHITPSGSLQRFLFARFIH